MEDVERASERLENIQSVKPILGGLRTISLGSWQAALKRRSNVRDYAERIRAVLPALLPELERRETVVTRARRHLSLPQTLSALRAGGSRPERRPKHYVALALGSERGLCGRFNAAIADEVERYLEDCAAAGVTTQLMVLGSRAERTLRRRGHEPIQAGTLSMTSLPAASLAFDLARRWLASYEDHELDAVDLIHNHYRGTGTYRPTVTRLIPPQLVKEGTRVAERENAGRTEGSRSRSTGPLRPPWPPPIIDTDPLSLYGTVIEQSTAVHLYSILLDSSAAEHSTRFQLMESATQNADRLIEELTLSIQTARRHEITQEMAELAVGAGLLKDR